MKFLTLFFFFVLFGTANAQTSLPLREVASSKDDAFREAVSGGIYLLRQNYVFVSDKTGNEYGREGKDFCGSAYEFGVLLNGRVYFSPRLLKPWLNDPYYVKIDSLREKTLDNVHYRLFKQTVAHYAKSDLTDKTLGTKLISSPINAKGFDAVGQITSGRLVEILVKNTADDGEPVIYEMRISSANWDVEGDNLKLKTLYKTDKQLSTAFLFSEEISLGNIKILPVGVYCQNEKGEWTWQLLKENKANSLENIKPLNTDNKPNEQEKTAVLIDALNENLRLNKELLNKVEKASFTEAEKTALKKWSESLDTVLKQWKKVIKKLRK